MATDNTRSTLLSLLKELYPPWKVPDLAAGKHAFLQLLPKFDGVGGKYTSMGFADGSGGGSATASNAITNGGALNNEQFAVTLAKHYEVGSIDRFLAKISLKDGSLIKVVEGIVEDKVNQAKNAINTHLVAGDGTGISGRISAGSSVSSATITLADKETANRFEIGDVVQCYSAVATARSGSNTLTGVNYDTGTLTTTTSWATGVGAAAALDYLVIQGDGAAVATGLPGWLPTSAPDSTAFFGVNRSVSSRRYGTIIDGRGLNLTESFNKGIGKIQKNGGDPDYLLTSPAQFVRLQDEVSAQVQFTNPSGKANLGFNFIQAPKLGGMVKVITDRFMDSDKAYALTMDTWKLISAGTVPELQDDYGDKYLRDNAADAFEFRISAYYNLLCMAPCKNGVIRLDAVDLV